MSDVILSLNTSGHGGDSTT